MKKFKCQLILLISVSFIVSCSSKSIERQINAMNTTNVFKQEIGDANNTRQSKAVDYIRVVSSQLGMRMIDKGEDQFQMRIWFTYGLNDTAQLFMIKKDGNEWTSEQLTFVLHYDSTQNVIVDTNKINIAKKTPKSGWNTFLEKLYDLEIVKLPDGDALIRGKYDISHGDVVTVEVSASKMYRLYTYVNSQFYTDKFWQAANIQKMLQIIEEDFQFRLLTR